MMPSKRIDDLNYYTQTKNEQEGKMRALTLTHQDVDRMVSEKRGIVYDPSGVYAQFGFKNGEVVNGQKLEKYADGYNPVTNTLLTQTARQKLRPEEAGQKSETRRLGRDMTPSVPKSLSVLYSQAPDALKKKLEEIVLRAAKKAVDSLQKYAGKTRTGAQGNGPPIDIQYMTHLFLDVTSRPTDAEGNPMPEEVWMAERAAALAASGDKKVLIDPGLHVHMLFINNVLSADGKHRAIEELFLLQNQGVAAEVFHSELAHSLQTEGFNIKNAEDGVAFTMPDVLQSACDAFSKRSQDIMKKKAEAGFENIDDTKLARGIENVIKVKGRLKHEEVTAEELEKHWVERGEIYGFTQRDVEKLLAEAQERRQQGIQIKLPTQEEVQKAVDALFDFESAVSAAKIRSEILGAFTGRGSSDQLLEIADAYVAEHCVVLQDDVAKQMVSIPRMIETENRIAELATTYQKSTFIEAAFVEEQIARIQADLATKNQSMTQQQTDAVRYLFSTKDGVACLVGKPGSGKSYSMNAVREIYANAGMVPVGVSLSWTASRNLADEAGIEKSAALADFAQQLKTGKIVLSDKHVIICDEAGLVGSADMDIILSAAKAANASVILTGDPDQISAVSAGGAFRMVMDEKRAAGMQHAAELTEIYRQEQQWDRDAGMKIAAGNAREALEDYMRMGRPDWKGYETDDLGRLTLEANKDSAMKALFDQYIKDYMDGERSQLVIAIRNEDVDQLNLMIREELQRKGLIERDVKIATVDTKGNKREQNFSVGETVQFRRKSREIDVDGEKITVYNRTRGKIKAIEGEGDNAQITLELYKGDKLSNRVITISAKNFRDGLPLEHAVACTVHSSQGLTFNKSYVLASGGAYDKAMSFVACTRHRKDLRIYSDLDSLHTCAEAKWSNTEFVKRAHFTKGMAIETLAQTWSTARTKVTTRDFMADRMAGAKVAQVAARTENARQLAKAQTEIMALENARCLNPEQVEKGMRGVMQPRIWNPERSQFIVVPQGSTEKIQDAIRLATKKFGNTLHVSGDTDFQRRFVIEAASRKLRSEIGPLNFSSEKTNRILKTVHQQALVAPKNELNSRAVRASQDEKAMRREMSRVHTPAPVITQKPEPTPERRRKPSQGMTR